MSKRKRRKFSAEFKTEVVLVVISGPKSQAEVCREHQISAQQLGNWKRQFLENASSVFAEYIIDMNQTIDEIPFELNLAEDA